MKSSTGAYRTGDVVRFVRGSNEYTGTIVFFHRTKAMCHVRIPVLDGVYALMLRHILAVEIPVLTEKERAALVELRRWSVSMPSKGLFQVAPTTLAGLSKRGLVEELVEGVTGKKRTWKISQEGRHAIA